MCEHRASPFHEEIRFFPLSLTYKTDGYSRVEKSGNFNNFTSFYPGKTMFPCMHKKSKKILYFLQIILNA